MRVESKEYGFDWLLWSTFQNSKYMMNVTPKEAASLFEIMPDKARTLKIFMRMKEAASAMLHAGAAWLDELVHAHQRGNKVVLTTYCYPVGILRAMRCVPLNMEVLTAFATMMWKRGTYDFLDYCVEAGMTETSCSGQRGAMGAYLAGIGTKPDFCLANTAGICDSNANAFHFYTSYKDIPMYMHDSPPDLTGERAKEYHRADFRRMLEFAEEQTGEKLDYDYLREVAKEIYKQDELISEIQTLMTHKPSPVPGLANTLIYLMKFAFNGLPDGTAILEGVLKASKENYEKGIAGTATGIEKARILTAYIDHYSPDMKFFDLFEKHDISNVGCMLNYFWNKGAPYTEGKEDETYEINLKDENSIIDSLADQLSRMPMIKQIRGPYDAPTQWLEDTLSAARVYDVDGTIYCGTLGCRNTWGMVKPFARDTEAAGIPTFILFADAFDERITSWEACENKLTEFMRVRGIIT